MFYIYDKTIDTIIGRSDSLTVPLSMEQEYLPDTPENQASFVAYTQSIVPMGNSVYQVSQDTILRRLEAMGKTLAFLDVLDRSEPPFRKAKAFFFASKYIMSDDPLFNEFAPMLKQEIGLSAAEFASVIAPEDDSIL